MRRFLFVPWLAGALLAQHGPRTSIEGRVVDVLGEPVPAATVTATVQGVRVARTATDGEGIYLLSGVPARDLELRFRAAGKAELSVPSRGSTGPRVRNVVLEDGARLHGHVRTAAGDGAAGATVVVAAARFEAEVVAGADGAFELPSVPLRRAIVRAWTQAGWAEASLRLAGDTRCDLTLPARASGIRFVRVRGLPAGALAAARLEVTSSDLALLANRGHVALRADGKAHVTPTENSLVQLVAPGFDASPLGYLVCEGESTAPIEFAVQPAPGEPVRTIEGRVLDGRARPVQGPRLVLRDLSGCELDSAVVVAGGAFRLSRPRQVQACRLGLELAEWHLVDESTTFADGFSWIHVPAGKDGRFDLFVEPLGHVRGELRGIGGAQLVLAEITASIEDPHPVTLRGFSDRSGMFELHAPAGEYELFAIASDGQTAFARTHVRPKQADTGIRWQLLPSGSLEGRVLDERGEPMPGRELVLLSEFDAGTSATAARYRRTVLTDRSGRYRCRGLLPGHWTVSAADEPDLAGSGEVLAGGTTSIVIRLAR
jgi:hypothetical protein